MKKSIIAVAVFACLLLGGCSAPQSSSKPVSEPASVPAASMAASASSAASESMPASDSAQEDSIAGNVNDATMNTMEIETADGYIFRFSTMDVPIEAPADGVIIGDDAEVFFEGTLDENKDTQDVTVIRIVVTRPDASGN